MACLRSEFEAWATSEPAEPESDNPTEEENAKFEAEEKEHEAKVRYYDEIEGNLHAFCWCLSLFSMFVPYCSLRSWII